MQIVVVGAGFVGLVTAACLAERGHQVMCIEHDPTRLSAVKDGIVPFHEPGLPQLLKAGIASNRLQFGGQIGDAVSQCDLVFLAVGTPNADERIDLSQIKAAAKDVGNGLARAKRYIVVVVKSTVVPGTTAGPLRQVLEDSSGLQAGRDFGLCMNPEFLRQGFAVEDFMNSDRLVLGSLDPRSAAAINEVYADFDCPKLETSLNNAEMSKYASNVLLATLISYSNEIASICERMPGTDVEFVMDALSLDRRLSPRADGKRISPDILSYLRAGSGFGGSCLPKDISALRQTAREHGVEPRLMDAVVAVNAERPANLLRLATQAAGNLRNRKVALLGLTFKAGTDDLRDSPALAILDLLLEQGAAVFAFDPQISPDRQAAIDRRAKVVSTAVEALEGARLAIISTAWPEFAKLDWERLSKIMLDPVVVDGRNLLKAVRFPTGVRYYRIGHHGPC